MASASSGKPALSKRLFRLARILAVQCFFLVFFLEILGRLLDPLGVSYYPEMARFLDTLIIEEPIGYRHQPELKDRFFGVDVQINSLGLRDREVPEAKEENEFRLLVMGDSVPFGIGVQYEDSIPHQLERIAQQNLGTEKQIRTINMGVPSYNTEQELVQLQSLGLSLKPDAIVLIYARNDIQPKMWVFGKRESMLVNLSQRSYAASLLYTLFRKFNKNLGDRQTMVDDFNRPKHDHPGWRRVEISLTAISELCRQNQIPFALATRGSDQSGVVNHLRDIGLKEGFPVFHWQFEAGKRLVNSATDGHPNPEGSRFIAQFLYDRLSEKKFFHDQESDDRELDTELDEP